MDAVSNAPRAERRLDTTSIAVSAGLQKAGAHGSAGGGAP